MSYLKVAGLGKKYGHRYVVQDVNLYVKGGEVVGLLGPNGAGKSTSFYMITGLVPCDKGEVILDDLDISKRPIHIRARMGLGYLPQETSVFKKLTVKENIFAILETRKEISINEKKNILQKLLTELNILHVKDTLGHQLSGGERRRVEIGRALAIEPKFMLLDEPFAGVDPISVSDIQRYIGYLSKKGIGVLITDHNILETLRICDRAYIVNEGNIIAAGKPEEVVNNQQVRKVYLGEHFRY